MNETLTKSQRVVRVVCTVALFILAVFWLIPVFWCILNSLKTNVEFLNSYSNFTTRWEYLKAVFPEKFNLQSYISLFTGEGLSTIARLDTMILNSLAVSVVVTAVVVFVTSLSAFAYEEYYGEYLSTNANFSKILGRAEDFDALVADLSATDDAAERAKLLKELQILEQELLYKMPIAVFGNYIYINTDKIDIGETVFGNPYYNYQLNFANWTVK